MKGFFKYVLSRLDNTTAWVGVIGLILLSLGFHAALAVLFVLLFVLPEGNFSDLFKGWTREIRSLGETDGSNNNPPRY